MSLFRARVVGGVVIVLCCVLWDRGLIINYWRSMESRYLLDRGGRGFLDLVTGRWRLYSCALPSPFACSSVFTKGAEEKFLKGGIIVTVVVAVGLDHLWHVSVVFAVGVLVLSPRAYCNRDAGRMD